MRMRRGSVVLVVAIGLWAVTTVGWLGLIAVERAFKSDMTCDLVEGGSDYGDATWSWFPPGVSCTWDLQPRGVDLVITEDPPAARVGMALVLVLWGASLAGLAMRRRSGTPRGAAPAESERSTR